MSKKGGVCDFLGAFGPFPNSIMVCALTSLPGSLSLSFSNSAFFQRKTLLTLYDPLVSIFRGNVHCGRSSYFHPVPPQKKFLHKLFHKPLPGQHVTLHLSLSALLSSLLVYDGTRLNKWQQFYPHIIDLMAQFSIL